MLVHSSVILLANILLGQWAIFISCSALQGQPSLTLHVLIEAELVAALLCTTWSNVRNIELNLRYTDLSSHTGQVLNGSWFACQQLSGF